MNSVGRATNKRETPLRGYGVVGTALIQAVLLAIGLAVAGVPGAAMLGFVTLLLAISQIGGPLLVLIWGRCRLVAVCAGSAGLGRLRYRLCGACPGQ